MLAAPDPGNTDGPFLTVGKAVSAVRNRPGSTVQIRNGTYFLPSVITFDSGDSGNPGSPTTYENYSGETPVISGGVQLTGWSDAGSACNETSFTTDGTLNTFTPTYYTFSGWQALGEDTHSMVTNPGFTNPVYPTDDYTLSPTSSALQLGFVPFDLT